MHSHGCVCVHVGLRGMSDLRARYKRLLTVRCRGLDRNGVMKQRPGRPTGASGAWAVLLDWLEVMRMFF